MSIGGQYGDEPKFDVAAISAIVVLGIVAFVVAVVSAFMAGMAYPN